MPTSTPPLTIRTVPREGILMCRALTGRLAEAERVPPISAPSESEETVLLRSWIAEAGWWAGGCVDVEPSGGR